MKDITIKIVGRRYNGDEMEDELEFVSDGTMYDRSGAKYIIYDESEFSGFPGCKTSLKLKDKALRLKRIGKVAESYGGELVFEEGKRFVSSYNTPYGDLDIEVLTTEVKSELGEDGLGTIRLAYNICLKGLVEGRNTSDIEIMQ